MRTTSVQTALDKAAVLLGNDARTAATLRMTRLPTEKQKPLRQKPMVDTSTDRVKPSPFG